MNLLSAIPEQLAYICLFSLATGLIYAGSHSTISRGGKDISEFLSVPFAEGGTRSDKKLVIGVLSVHEAIAIPIAGSVLWGTLWLILTYLDAEALRSMLSVCFNLQAAGGCSLATLALAEYLQGRLSPERFRTPYCSVSTRWTGRIDLRLNALLALLGTLPALIYFMSPSTPGIGKPPVLNNILAGALAYSTLSYLKLDSFRTGCVLLGGLFVYDLWWAFGISALIDVATNIDAPVLLLWPHAGWSSSYAGHVMLGLGDVIVPGCFVSLALRWDQERSRAASQATPILGHRVRRFPSNESESNSWDSSSGPLSIDLLRDYAFERQAVGTTFFPKPYFSATLGAYVLGLCLTDLAINFSGTAQPALLYISPACIGAFVLTAVYRDELAAAWRWTDGETSQPRFSPEKFTEFFFDVASGKESEKLYAHSVA